MERLLRPYHPRAYWERRGATFADEAYQRALHAQHEVLEAIIVRERPSSIVEVGCGFGRNLRFIQEISARNGFAIHLVGVDFSDSMLSSARSFLGPLDGVSLVQGDALALPFGDKSFDVVLLHGVLMHIRPQDVPVALREIGRVGVRKAVLMEEYSRAAEVQGRSIRINYFTYGHPYSLLLGNAGLAVHEHTRLKAENLDIFVLNLGSAARQGAGPHA